MPKFTFFPKDVKVFAFLEQDAENTVKMAKQLKDMIYIWQNVKERAGIIADMEQDGDAITHDIMRYLHRSFITPLDRDDISLLANALDDVADRIHAVADTAYLYGIKGPTDFAKQLVDIILKAVLEVEAGISELSTKIRVPELLKRCVSIHEIENAGDIAYHAALGDLFTHQYDIFDIVKWREVYLKMENAIDGCEVFAGVLEGIAMKYD
jgi:predicted phosphate transport protein (TIGR00153 family)